MLWFRSQAPTGSPPLVLLDATPLLGGSGFRGIGRYVFELMHGLEATRDQWSRQLRIRAVTSLSGNGGPAFSDDLATAAQWALERRGTLRSRQVRRWHLGPAARDAGASLLHVTEAIGTPVALSVPRIVTCYDLIPLRFPAQYLDLRVLYPVRWLTDWRRYARAQRIVAISERTRQDLQEVLRIPRSRIDVAVTGIDLERWAQTSGQDDDDVLAPLGLSGRPFAIYVGYSDYRKNVQGMFNAVALASERIDIELAWAGLIPPKRLASLRAQAARLGVADRVRFLGFVPDATLMALYRRAAAQLFLSRLEGFGLPVVEAMILGCPVIVARGSGSDEVAGSAGIVVDPDDPTAAADALVRFATDPAERSRNGELCKARARCFDRNEMALTYVQSYLKALADIASR